MLDFTQIKDILSFNNLKICFVMPTHDKQQLIRNYKNPLFPEDNFRFYELSKINNILIVDPKNKNSEIVKFHLLLIYIIFC